MLLTFVDTAARLSEIANLRVDDVDLEQGYLKVMARGEGRGVSPSVRRWPSPCSNTS